MADHLPGGFLEQQDAQQDQEASVRRALSSRQESKLIHFVDQKILGISRIFKNRAVQESHGESVAARNLDQLLAEVSSLVGLLSQVPESSASISVAYLLTLTDMVTDYVRVFNISPETTFETLADLDRTFVNLIKFHRVSMTEKTRLSGLAGRLRDVIYSKYDGMEEYEAKCSGVLEKTTELL